MTIKLGIIGAAGKMGKRVFSLAKEDPKFIIEAALNSRSQSLENLLNCDLIIDFSSAQSLNAHIDFALHHSKPLVIGTTGISDEQQKKMQLASEKIALFYAPNFSVGISLCMKIADLLSENLSKSWNVDVVEIHHTEKKDAPSGTALSLVGALKREAPIHSLRSGQIVGEHRLLLTSGTERIELKHEAFSRDTFAEGALNAAKFIITQPPGLYSMKDL